MCHVRLPKIHSCSSGAGRTAPAVATAVTSKNCYSTETARFPACFPRPIQPRSQGKTHKSSTIECGLGRQRENKAIRVKLLTDVCVAWLVPAAAVFAAPELHGACCSSGRVRQRTLKWRRVIADDFAHTPSRLGEPRHAAEQLQQQHSSSDAAQDLLRQNRTRKRAA